jgi:hypothetical protein
MIQIEHRKRPKLSALNRELRRAFPGAVASWGEEGTLYVQGVGEDGRAAAESIVAAHKPGLAFVPDAQRKQQRRAQALLELTTKVEASPVCRAIWDGADLSGFDPDDVQAARDMLLRYALLAGEVPAPDWTLESRYET